MSSKKFFTLLVFVFSCAAANAQLTLTSASFPQLGGIYISHNDSLGATLSPGTSGANQTWNYSILNNHYNDTSITMSVSSTPNGASYSSATLAGKNGAGYAYFNITTTEAQIIGLSGSILGSPLLNIHYITPNIVAKDGITFNSNYSFVNSFVITLAGADIGFPQFDSVRIHNNDHVKKIVDGWGTVTSPIGAFPCLRIKEIDSTVLIGDGLTSGFWIPNLYTRIRVKVSYSFVDDANLTPIVQLNMDSTSATVNNASYRESWPNEINDVVKPSLFTMYPNPASTNNIHLLIGGLPADKYVVQLFDLTGRQINSASYSINQTAVTDINFSTLQLCNGNYIAVVSTAENKILQSLKFEVVK